MLNNELLFITHVLLAFGITIFCLRKGEKALSVWGAVLPLLANLFVTKQALVFGWIVSTSDAYIIAGFISLNLLQEFYGKESGKRTANFSLALLVIFAVFSHLHISYTPPEGDAFHEAYLQVFSPAPRITLASLFTLFLVQRLDLFLFRELKKISFLSSLPVRAAVSLTLSQAVDTSLFTVLGLLGTVPNLLQIGVGSFAMKLIAITLSSPLLLLCRKAMREKKI